MPEQEPAEHVLEIVTPRTNAARLSAAENLFSALALARGRKADPIALEIVADGGGRRFQLRTTSVTDQQRIGRLLGAAYPQADLRPFGASDTPADAARQGPDEQCAACVLRPGRGEYLPLRTFVDRDLDGRSGSAQADPLLGVLSALVDLPSAWRALVQVVITGPAPVDWARRHQRLALERPLEAERARDSGPSPVLPIGLVGLVILYLIASSALAAWRRGEWLTVIGLAAATVLLASLTIASARWLGRHEIVDPRQVQAKLARDACLVELRLAVFAPDFADASCVYEVLENVAAAYRAYSSGAGNSLQAQVLNDAPDLRVLAPVGTPCLLNVQELAGLWHLLQATDDVPFVERTRARRRLPLPETVAADAFGDSCRIGVSAHQGHAVPVHLPTALLNRHLLAIAKTRRGKSSLLLRLAQHLMTIGTTGVGRTGGRG
ncbi:MAG TPA: hypothetical protein VGK33_14495, partial [Chloroflexota bacterium]